MSLRAKKNNIRQLARPGLQVVARRVVQDNPVVVGSTVAVVPGYYSDEPLLAGAGVGQLPCDSNIPVGVMPTWKYSLQEALIYTGTAILLFTDGLTEAENAEQAQFQMERVTQVAEQALANKQLQPRQLIGLMTDAVHRFVGDAEQSDDLTMMVIQYIHQPEDAQPA